MHFIRKTQNKYSLDSICVLFKVDSVTWLCYRFFPAWLARSQPVSETEAVEADRIVASEVTDTLSHSLSIHRSFSCAPSVSPGLGLAPRGQGGTDGEGEAGHSRCVGGRLDEQGDSPRMGGTETVVFCLLGCAFIL